MVDNDENQTESGLTLITHAQPARKVFRGVIESVGSDCQEACTIGEVVHYTDYCELLGMHVVPEQHILAFGG